MPETADDHMLPNDRTPIPADARRALGIVQDAVAARSDGGFDRRRAAEALVAAGFDEAAAEDCIEVLLNRGYLYAVDDSLFVTDPEESLERADG